MAIDLSWATLNPFREKPGGGNTNNPQPEPKPEPKKDPNDLSNKVAEGGDDPMLKFENLWEPGKDKDGKVIENKSNDSNSPYLPQIDSKKLNELVGKMDFTRGVDPQHWKDIAEGGEKAAAAVAQIVNSVGRQSFTTAFSASTKLAEQGFASSKTRFMGEVPAHVRDLFVEEGMQDSIGIMKNPAFSPIVKSVKDQYLAKFPKATPGEINNALKEYFSYLKNEMSTNETNQNKEIDDPSKKLRTGAPDADFVGWLGKEISGLGASSDADTVQGGQ